MVELELCVLVDMKRLCSPACRDRAATRAMERLNIVKRLGGMSGDGISNWQAGERQLLGWDAMRIVCWKDEVQRTAGEVRIFRAQPMNAHLS